MTVCIAKRHDTVYAYNHHLCRCDTARRAKARQDKMLDLRTLALGHGLWVDTTGTTRRLRALAATGWTTRQLADLLGSHQAQVRKWLAGDSRVHVDTAARVNSLYARLSETPGPSKRTTSWARRQGWIPPIGWDAETIDDPTVQPYAEEEVDVDPVVVERLIAGKRVPHTRAERLAAIAQMHAAGMLPNPIALRLHRSHGNVMRDLAELGLTAGVAA